MNRKQTDIREVLSYYTESDWAACACTLVRKFGIQGGAALLKSIRDSISAINAIKGVTDSGLKLLRQLDSMMSRMFPGSIITRELYKRIAKINICPAVSDLMLSIGGSATDVLSQAELQKWMEDKHKTLNSFMTENIGKVEDQLLKLQKLENFMKLMEGCASNAISDGRNYGLDVAAQDTIAKNTYAPIMKNLSRIISANIAAVNGEIWAAYSEDDIVSVVRKIGGEWISAVDVVKGSTPNILFDGTNVYLYFTYLNKIQELSFLPIELGYYGVPLSLWDCIRYSSLVMPPVKQVFKGCEGIFGSCNRVVANAVNAMSFVSYPDDCPGAIPVPINLGLNDTQIWWDSIVVDGIFAKNLTYKIYEEGILIGEVSGNTLVYDVLGYTNYWVKASINDWYNDIYDSCPSEKKYVTGFIKSKDYVKVGSSKYNSISFVNYDITINDYADYVGKGSSEVNIKNYLLFVNYDIIIEPYSDFSGGAGSYKMIPIFVSYWPAQLS